MTTRPLVYIQVPEVVEIVKQVQVVIDKKKPKKGESPIKKIVKEQNLPDMMLLRHVWGYGKDDVGKKTITAIFLQVPQRKDVSEGTCDDRFFVNKIRHN